MIITRRLIGTGSVQRNGTPQKIYEDILKNCSEAIPNEKPCDEIEFEETIGSDRPDYKTVEIDLPFDVILSIEEERIRSSSSSSTCSVRLERK